MKINLIAVGQRMPAWVTDAFQEYNKRLPPELQLKLIETPLAKRSKTSVMQKLIDQEGEQMLAHIPPQDHVIALEVKGKAWSTEELAKQLQNWQHDGRNINLLIGGPDGLSQRCLERAEQRWSLSPLTLPHPLVRVIIAEQIYRAWSILSGHPYHR